MLERKVSTLIQTDQGSYRKLRKVVRTSLKEKLVTKCAIKVSSFNIWGKEFLQLQKQEEKGINQL